jgi:hypothetical protein
MRRPRRLDAGGRVRGGGRTRDASRIHSWHCRLRRRPVGCALRRRCSHHMARAIATNPVATASRLQHGGPAEVRTPAAISSGTITESGSRVAVEAV